VFHFGLPVLAKQVGKLALQRHPTVHFLEQRLFGFSHGSLSQWLRHAQLPQPLPFPLHALLGGAGVGGAGVAWHSPKFPSEAALPAILVPLELFNVQETSAGKLPELIV